MRALTPGGLAPYHRPTCSEATGTPLSADRPPPRTPVDRSLTPGTGSESASAAVAPDDRAIQGIRPASDATSPDVEIIGVTKRFGDVTAVDQMDLRIARGDVLQPPRPVGLRQDDDPADDRRLRAADRGRDPARRHSRSPASRRTSATSTRSSSTTRCSRTWTSPATSATACARHKVGKAEEQRRVSRGPRARPPGRLRAAPDVGDVRRPAAARRARAGPGQPPDGAAPRRAARARST